MHVVIVNKVKIPVFAYGGTERVIWDLAKSLVKLGHRVTFLVPEGSFCDFAQVAFFDINLPLRNQIPANADVVHFNFSPQELNIKKPYVITEHFNSALGIELDVNSIFISKDHAQRYDSECYVYNGLDWSAYGKVDWSVERKNYHFLAKAETRTKNLRGAISVAKKAGIDLDVLGGHRFSFKRGYPWTLSPRIKYHGMVGGEVKLKLLNRSQGLIFPVRWFEPFGLAVIESMYFGAPVFATPYGSLPELVPEWAGQLSVDSNELVNAIHSRTFEKERIHQHVVENFNSDKMATGYLDKYNKVIAGESLNKKPPKTHKKYNKLYWIN